jgi:hypothetical protein
MGAVNSGIFERYRNAQLAPVPRKYEVPYAVLATVPGG